MEDNYYQHGSTSETGVGTPAHLINAYLQSRGWTTSALARPFLEQYGLYSREDGTTRSLATLNGNPTLYNRILSDLGQTAESLQAQLSGTKTVPGSVRAQGSAAVNDYLEEHQTSESTNGGTTQSGSSGDSNVVGGVDISTLPPELQETLKGINTYLQKLTANGQVVNPNLELTPEKLAEFTAQAQNEINPYYATQLKLARENLLVGAGYSTKEIQENEQELAKKYNIAFKQVGANAADQGFAQSGARVVAENDLAAETQNTIDANRRRLSFDLGNSQRDFAQRYGATNVPDLQIGEAPTAYKGEPNLISGTGARSLYTLDPAIYDGLVGSQEYQQRADVTNRVSQLTGAFNANAALQQQRALTL